MSRLVAEQRVPIAVLAAAFLFNLGQGVLQPSMPLYLQRAFGANYRCGAVLLTLTAWRCHRGGRAIVNAITVEGRGW